MLNKLIKELNLKFSWELLMECAYEIMQQGFHFTQASSDGFTTVKLLNKYNDVLFARKDYISSNQAFYEIVIEFNNACLTEDQKGNVEKPMKKDNPWV